MIKGGSYLKLFVLGLFTLLISCFTFGVNYSEAGYVRQVGYYGYNPYDQSFNINITRNGTFLTESLGLTRSLFSFKNNIAFLWSDKGVPYFVGVLEGEVSEGYFNNYYVCDEITTLTNSPSNCSYREVGYYTNSQIGTFLNSITSEDNFYFDLSRSRPSLSSYYCETASLCLSSSSLGQSLCFFVANRGNGGITCSYRNDNVLTGSLLLYTYLPDLFSNIPNVFLNDPPSVGGGLDNGNTLINISTGVQSELTGNLVYSDNSNSCTRYKALEYYKSIGLTDTLCYSNFQTLTGLGGGDWGLTYADIWFDTLNLRWGGDVGTNMSESKWFDFWRYAYRTYKDGIHSYNELFSGIPNALPGYFGKLYLVGNDVPTENILEYCTYSIYEPSNNGLLYTGVNFSSICRITPGGVGINPLRPGTEISSSGSSSNSSISSIDMGGFGTIGQGSTGLTIQQNGKSFISDSYNLIKTKIGIPKQSDFGLGILPNYIIIAFIGLIFFRFLMK